MGVKIAVLSLFNCVTSKLSVLALSSLVSYFKCVVYAPAGKQTSKSIIFALCVFFVFFFFVISLSLLDK